MPRRLNTIIIVPHSKARFFKFSFSTRTLVAVACAASVALVLSVIAIAFTGSAVNRRLEVQRLKSENVELAGVNQVDIAGEPVVNRYAGRASVEIHLRDVMRT